MSEIHTDSVEAPDFGRGAIHEASELLEAEFAGELNDEAEPKVQPEAEAEAEPEAQPETEASADYDGGDVEPSESEEGVEIPDIDYDQLIPMPGGEEPIKLGELKDLAVKAKSVDSEMIERENQIMREHDELRQLIASVGQVPDEVKQAQQQHMQRHLEREHQAMLDAIPDWKDPATFKADRTEIVELGQQYGFSAEDISQISDHRAVKMLRDYSRMLKSRQANVEQIKKVAKPKPKKSTANKRTIAQKKFEAARNGGVGDKVAAINELLAS